MQFAKTEASHCSCCGIQCYDPGRDVMVSFVKASTSIGSQYWSNGLLLQLKNNWHMKLINPCSNFINILNGVITRMILPLCSNARGNCPGEPITKVWQGCLRKAFFCLFQCKMKCPDGLENLLVFWDFELFTALMVQVSPMRGWAPGLWHSSDALGTLPIACCVATLPSVSLTGMHSLSHHTAALRAFSFTFVVSSPCPSIWPWFICLLLPVRRAALPGVCHWTKNC